MIRIECVVNKSCSPNSIFLRENHFQEDSVNFWLQKLTLKTKNAHFLPAHHYTLLVFYSNFPVSKNLLNEMVIKQGYRKIKISDDSSVKMEHLWMDLEKEEQPEFLKPKLIT